MEMQKIAYRRLRRSILSGSVRPGQRLSHRKLAVELQVGLRPMREAMLRLDAEGLLEHLPQSGTRLRKPSVVEARNLSDLRELIEPYAAARAARFAKPREKRLIEQLCRRFSALTPELVRGGAQAWLGELGTRSRVLDLKFHRTILAASGNASALAMFDRVGVLPLLFLNHPDVVEDIEADVQRADGDHQAIAEAICAGDAATAARAMEVHLGAARFTAISYSPLPQATDSSRHPQRNS